MRISKNKNQNSGKPLFGYLFLISLLTVGCSKYYYNPAPQVLPQYIRKLAIRAFTNRFTSAMDRGFSGVNLIVPLLTSKPASSFRNLFCVAGLAA